MRGILNTSKFDVNYLNIIEYKKIPQWKYEKQLRESGEYTETQIQEKLSKKKFYNIN